MRIAEWWRRRREASLVRRIVRSVKSPDDFFFGFGVFGRGETPVPQEVKREVYLRMIEAGNDAVATKAVTCLHEAVRSSPWKDRTGLFSRLARLYLEDRRSSVREAAIKTLFGSLRQFTELPAASGFPRPVIEALASTFERRAEGPALADWLAFEFGAQYGATDGRGFRPTLAFSGGVERLIEAVRQYARDESASDRSVAVVGLCLLEDVRCRDALMEFSQDKDALIRDNALKGLEAISALPTQEGAVPQRADESTRVSVRLRVTLPEVTDPTARVYVAGSFNGWDPRGLLTERDGPRTAIATLLLSPETEVEYKYTCGSWNTVEKDQEGGDVPNRHFTVRPDGGGERQITDVVSRWASKLQADPGKLPAKDAEEGFRALRSKQWTQAVRAFRQALSHVPSDAATWSNLGAVYYLFVKENMIPHVGRDFRICIDVFGEAGTSSQAVRDTLLALTDEAHFRGLRRCLAEAEKCFDHALSLAGAHTAARYWRALVYRDTGRLELARSELNIVVGSPQVPENERQEAGKSLALVEQVISEGMRPVPPGSFVGALPIHEIFGGELRTLLVGLDAAAR